jgi:hypothetical protein
MPLGAKEIPTTPAWWISLSAPIVMFNFGREFCANPNRGDLTSLWWDLV